MSLRIQLFSIAVGIGVFSVILELVRRKRLREEYSLLWLALGFLMIVIPVWKGGFFALARLLQVADASSLLFLFGIVFLAVYTVHLSVALTNLRDERERLAIELAMLRKDMEEREAKSVSSDPG